MAATEADILRDEQERSSLLKVIADVETAVIAAASGTRRILENTLENAKKQVATLDKKIEEARMEYAAEVQAKVAAAEALAAKETRLTAEERETYRGFLEKPYFTKKDFGEVDQFCRRGYDRLSESGKEEMSKRIDEGIKRGEFKFSDLPETIQSKETAHRAARAGKNSPAQQEVSKKEDDASYRSPLAETSAMNGNDLRSIDLSGMKISHSLTEPSAAAMPDASGSKPVQRSV